MPPCNIAVATRCLRRPLKGAVTAAAKMGVRGVQLEVGREVAPSEFSDTGRRQFLNLLKDVNLRTASLSCPVRGTLYDEERLDDRVEAVKAAMQFAFQLQATVLTVNPGPIPDDPESAETLLLTEVLNDLARYGNHVGATLAITPLGESPQVIRGLLERIDAGPIGVDFDAARFAVSGRNPADALRALYDYVVHVQVRDAVRDVDGSVLEVPVGRGEVDWIELLPVLDEIEYRGWLTVIRNSGDDVVGDMARAVEYLRQLSLE